MATIPQFEIPDSEKRRLENHPDYPTKRKGKSNIPEFYRRIFEDYMNSAEFKLKEALAALREVDSLRKRVKALEGQVQFWKEKADRKG